MRITFVLNGLGMNGGYRVIAQYAECLRLRGHEVNLVSAASRGWLDEPRWKSVVKALMGRSSEWQKVATSNRFSAALYGWKAGKPPWRWGPSQFDEFPDIHPITVPFDRPIQDQDLPDADVVVATWWETAFWVAALSPSKGAKANFIQQYEANFDQDAGAVDATWRLPMHKIVISRWLADLAATRFGDDSYSLATNGVNTDLFDAPPRGKQARPTVGVLYSTLPPKSWATALAVLIEAKRQVADLRILVFGMMQPSPSLPIPPDAEFEVLPSQAHIREIYSMCDVWLCASSSEGWHLPPHEAMACRCPVVSTNVGGPMDYITEGVNGYLVEPFDAVTLADRLVAVLNLREDRWREMSDEAYREARSHRYDLATDRLEAALRMAVERTARGDFEPTAPESPALNSRRSGIGTGG